VVTHGSTRTPYFCFNYTPVFTDDLVREGGEQANGRSAGGVNYVSHLSYKVLKINVIPPISLLDKTNMDKNIGTLSKYSNQFKKKKSTPYCIRIIKQKTTKPDRKGQSSKGHHAIIFSNKVHAQWFAHSIAG